MTLQQLIYAVTIYQCGSITQAAKQLYMAQPNLSTALQSLEEEIGYPIFQRLPKGVSLTERGETFIRQAANIVAQVERLERKQSYDGPHVSTLSLVTARSSVACMSMIDYVNELNEKGDSFRVKLREATNYDVINDVSTGNADIGIVRVNSMDEGYFNQLIEFRKLCSILLSSHPYRVLLSLDHPLAKKEYITQDMLEPFIEVVYGDYDMPMYPFSRYKYREIGQDVQDGQNKRLMFVYDRSSLMEVLSNVPGSYLWTTTTHPFLKEAYKLTERKCDAPSVEGTDIVIYNKSHLLTSEMKQFINLLLRKAGKEEKFEDAS